MGQALASNLQLQLPLLTASDVLVARNVTEELQNKTINSAKNTIIGFPKLPSAGKWGAIQTGAAFGGGSGQGLLYGFIDQPALPTRLVGEPPEGIYWNYNSGTVANTITGITFPQTFIRKTFDPRLRVRFRVPTSSNLCRLLVGMSTDTAIPADDTFIGTTNSGIVVGWRSTDTTFKVFRNGGTNAASATPTVVDTLQGKSTSLRSIEIAFTGGGTNCTVTLYSEITVPPTVLYTQTFSTNLPATGFSMSPSIILSNTSTAAKDLQVFYAEYSQTI